MTRPNKKPSIAARMANLLVRFYQLMLSPVIHALFGPGAGCRFQPSCSCYAGEAFVNHGFFRGAWLALKRILRCHPWSPGGYDPVPDLKTEESKDIAPSLKRI